MPTTSGEADEPLFEAIEQAVLGSGPRYTPPQVCERTGTPEDTARQLWRAMGFPQIPSEEAVLTERDERALREARSVVDAGFHQEQIIRQARVMSQAMATVAASQVEAVDVTSPAEIAQLVAAFSEEGSGLLATFDRLLAYLYRRHLVAALERVATLSTDESGLGSLAVGFADLAGFTATSSSVSARKLADVADVFAAAAADVVAECGGRVIKLVGDEVLFTVDDPAAAAEAVLRVVESGRGPAGGLQVHAGVALGPVRQHLGDVFGATVNRASRLTDAARPGTALVDEDMYRRLAGDDRFQLKRLHARPLKGLGAVRPFVLRRGPAPCSVGWPGRANR